MDGLKIYSVNINSLRAVDTLDDGTRLQRLTRLKQRIEQHETKIDVILVQETKLDNTIANSTLEIPGYNLYRRDRNSSGGGLATYVRKDITITVMGLTISPLFEALSLYIIVGDATVTVTNTYRPPGMSTLTFAALLCAHHASTALLTNYSVVGGDFNTCLNNDRQFGNLVLDKVTTTLCKPTAFLKPTIIVPTHGTRIIDQIYIPFKARIIDAFRHSGTEEPLESRHRPVYVHFVIPEESSEEESDDESLRNGAVEVEEIPARIKQKLDEMLKDEITRENYEACKKYVFKHLQYYVTIDIAEELLKHIRDEISKLLEAEIQTVTQRHLDELRLFRDLIYEYKNSIVQHRPVSRTANSNTVETYAVNTKTLVFACKSINSAAKAAVITGKTASAAGKAAGAMSKTGTALVKTKYVIPVAVAFDTMRIGSAIASGDGKQIFKTTAKVGGEWGGGWAGATAGAAFGTAVLPFGGTVVGGIIGGLFGALSGGWATEKVAEAIVD
uniref:Endonuclease/exonuclease/phosphatase domain-containing protein n=1 Tax=Panagrolaimus davidi TaxID=227884 RepID=A0A914QY88_9BILA